jgi:aminopeptidase N
VKTGTAAALLAVLALCALRAAAVPMHELSVQLDPDTRLLDARDTITLDARRAVTLVLGTLFSVHTLAVDGRPVKPRAVTRGSVQRIALPAGRRIDVHWTGTLAPLERRLDYRAVLSYQVPASGPQGTFLSSGSAWYPAVEGELERYRATLDVPASQRGVLPGRLVEETESAGRYRARFEFDAPSDGIALMAGPYRIQERQLRSAAGTALRLRTYFHEEVASLAPSYLDSLLQYLDLYERWIGPYPFSEFSVVSSPTPTGFGLPTLTYLGIEVLRLPFIRATSLGHEVLHSWWGNGVYPDYARGNWSESLTTFMADYAYRERAGGEAAHAMRLGWLRDYDALSPEQDSALIRFTSRTHGASQIIGYNKGAMLFLMLRDVIGGSAFDEGVRRFWSGHRFQVASWDDLRAAFERASGRPLGDFFGQWLQRAGAADVRISDAQAQRAQAGWRLSVTLTQAAPAYALSVPLSIRTADMHTVRRFDVAREVERIVLDLDSEPLSVKLDPEHRLFRRLHPDEAPPILREVMLSRDAHAITLFTEESLQQAAGKLVARFFESAPRPVPGDRAPGSATALVLGTPEQVDRWLAQHGLPARPANLGAARGSAQVWTVRPPGKRTLALVSAQDGKALAALSQPLPHYGRQSHVIFDGARVHESGIWPAQPPTHFVRRTR